MFYQIHLFFKIKENALQKKDIYIYYVDHAAHSLLLLQVRPYMGAII